MDIGQGDAILVCTLTNDCGLIDTGKSQIVVEKIKQYTKKSLNFLAITHKDLDHSGQLTNIYKDIGFKQLLISCPTINLSIDIKNALDMNTPIYEIDNTSEFWFGGFKFKALWPQQNCSDIKNTNDSSIAFLIENKDMELFTLGDLSYKFEEKALANMNSNNNRFKILKASHHGSKTSTSEEVLNLLQPNLAIISVGRNSYGHPSQRVIDDLTKKNVNILRTDISGDIKILLDDNSFRITNTGDKKSLIVLN